MTSVSPWKKVTAPKTTLDLSTLPDTPTSTAQPPSHHRQHHQTLTTSKRTPFRKLSFGSQGDAPALSSTAQNKPKPPTSFEEDLKLIMESTKNTSIQEEPAGQQSAGKPTDPRRRRRRRKTPAHSQDTQAHTQAQQRQTQPEKQGHGHATLAGKQHKRQDKGTARRGGNQASRAPKAGVAPQTMSSHQQHQLPTMTMPLMAMPPMAMAPSTMPMQMNPSIMPMQPLLPVRAPAAPLYVPQAHRPAPASASASAPASASVSAPGGKGSLVVSGDKAKRGIQHKHSEDEKRSQRPKLTKDASARRTEQRMKQIKFGKNTPEYHNYLKLVPVDERRREHPRTPDPIRDVSKRCFDGLLKKWRRDLHKYGKTESDEDADEDAEEATADMFDASLSDSDLDVTTGSSLEEETERFLNDDQNDYLNSEMEKGNDILPGLLDGASE